MPTSDSLNAEHGIPDHAVQRDGKDGQLHLTDPSLLTSSIQLRLQERTELPSMLATRTKFVTRVSTRRNRDFYPPPAATGLSLLFSVLFMP